MRRRAEEDKKVEDLSRRKFLKAAIGTAAVGAAAPLLPLLPAGGVRKAGATTKLAPESIFKDYDPRGHYYSFVVDTRKCIGCGSCVLACSKENKVPKGLYRTWVERYQIQPGAEHANIDSPEGGIAGFTDVLLGYGNVSKAFFVPKMCNHCDASPCVQVCPLGASYRSPDGVVLVDPTRCMGCGYCVQACPYSSRWLNPITHTADKCTWCYHRITKGLRNACVQACPTGARQFGDIRDPYDPVLHMIEKERIRVLQPHHLTKPKCYYIGLDREVV
jgi:Fe-S-cluster-containing dehydrogenase component